VRQRPSKALAPSTPVAQFACFIEFAGSKFFFGFVVAEDCGIVSAEKNDGRSEMSGRYADAHPARPKLWGKGSEFLVEELLYAPGRR